MTEQLKLSKRLEVIASYAKGSATFADIGSDHAYLPCRICIEDSSVKAIAGEIQKGPYANAVKTIERYGLTEQIDVRLGDGLEVIYADDKVDTVIIAGMGGQLIVDILARGYEKLKFVETIIIQPNTNAQLIRKYLHETSYHLINEVILEENGIIYEILIAKNKASNPYAENTFIRKKQFYFGPFLLQNRSPIFIKKWQQEYRHLEHIVNQLIQARDVNTAKLANLETEMTWIKEDLF